MQPYAIIKTKFGEMEIKFFPDVAPKHVENFVTLAKSGFYDKTLFHRVIPGFMIQGGDPMGTGSGGPGYKIRDEFAPDNRNGRGTISMANAGPNTGGSQFFINVVDNRRLDTKHPVFGRVVAGMDVADAISEAPRDERDRPREKVTILKASVL